MAILSAKAESLHARFVKKVVELRGFLFMTELVSGRAADGVRSEDESEVRSWTGEYVDGREFVGQFVQDVMEDVMMVETPSPFADTIPPAFDELEREVAATVRQAILESRQEPPPPGVSPASHAGFAAARASWQQAAIHFERIDQLSAQVKLGDQVKMFDPVAILTKCLGLSLSPMVQAGRAIYLLKLSDLCGLFPAHPKLEEWFSAAIDLYDCKSIFANVPLVVMDDDLAPLLVRLGATGGAAASLKRLIEEYAARPPTVEEVVTRIRAL